MREIPTGKQMPSVTMIDIGKKPAGAPGLGAPGAEPEGATFTCPACGEKLTVEQASDEAAEGEPPMDEGKLA